MRVFATLRFVVLFTLCNIASCMLRELLHFLLYSTSVNVSPCARARVRACMCMCMCMCTCVCACASICVIVYVVELFHVCVNASISVKSEYVDSGMHN